MAADFQLLNSVSASLRLREKFGEDAIMNRKVKVAIEGRELFLTNLDKVFFPETGMTKGDVINYYRIIAPVLMPHVKDRTISLKRYPDGITDGYFYEKRCPPFHPPWIRTKKDELSRKKPDYCVLSDVPSLIWFVNLASVELHTFLHRIDGNQPTMVMFDLDPGPPAFLTESARVALMLRDLFDRIGLVCFAKMSGGKGIHLAIPLNVPVEYAETKQFARSVAQTVESRLPDLVVSNMNKSLRGGKVLIDWSQNDRHKTTVSVYSLRMHPKPTISAPVSWHEIEKAEKNKTMEKLLFSPEELLERVERVGDIWADVVAMKQKLP